MEKNINQKHLAYLNKKGKLIRSIILQLSDEELLKVFPAPDENVIKRLKRKSYRVIGKQSSIN